MDRGRHAMGSRWCAPAIVLGVTLAWPTAVLAGDGGAACLQGVSLDPAASSGSSAVFEAVYCHCEGADTFRIVQIWFGSEVSIMVPHVGGGHENGMLAWGDTPLMCAPGENTVLVAPHGSLDCANTTVSSMGNEVTVRWAVEFDPATFAGDQGVFFDAKGGAGEPEPRLGWTMMGTFTVVDDPVGADTGTDGSTGSATDDSTGGDVATGTADTGGQTGLSPTQTGFGPDEADTGCSCRATERSTWPAWMLLVFAAVWLRGRRSRAVG